MFKGVFHIGTMNILCIFLCKRIIIYFLKHKANNWGRWHQRKVYVVCMESLQLNRLSGEHERQCYCCIILSDLSVRLEFFLHLLICHGLPNSTTLCITEFL